MSNTLETRRSCYDVHGIALAVEADAPAVVEALRSRLRNFETGPVGDPEVRLVFAASDEDRSAPEPDGGRPVYDTPYGSLYYFPEADAICGQLGGVQLRCEASLGLATLQSPSFIGRDLYLATHPLTTIALMELLERRGLFALHAACLASPDGDGLLLSGPSGAGKSTLAMAIAHAGLEFLSDDIVFLAPRVDASGEIETLGFADTVGLSDFIIERFPSLLDRAPTAPMPGFPKRLGRIENLLGRPAVSRCIPRVLIFPKITLGRPSTMGPIDPGEALLRLVPDVLLTDPSATQAHLRAIGMLLEQVRCYEVGSGEDLKRVAATIMSELPTSERSPCGPARARPARGRRC